MKFGMRKGHKMDALFEAMGFHRVDKNCTGCECGEDCEGIDAGLDSDEEDFWMPSFFQVKLAAAFPEPDLYKRVRAFLKEEEIDFEPDDSDKRVDGLVDDVDQLRHDLEVVQVKIKRLENWTSYEDEKEQ